MGFVNSIKKNMAWCLVAGLFLSGCTYQVNKEMTFGKEEPSVQNDVIVSGALASNSQGIFYTAKRVALPIPQSILGDGFSEVEAGATLFFDDFVLTEYYVFKEEEDNVYIRTKPSHYYISYDLYGNYLGQIEMSMDECLGSVYIDADLSGNMVFFKTKYNSDNDEIKIDAVTYDRYGKLVEGDKTLLSMRQLYIQGALITNDGDYVLLSQTEIYWIAGDGTFVEKYVADASDPGWPFFFGEFYKNDDNIYVEVIRFNGEESCETDLFNVKLSDVDGIELRDGRSTQNLAGMKIFRTHDGLYASTKNAMGKLDLKTGEFMQMIDWNQVDENRAVLVSSSVKVVKDGSFSQTISILDSVGQDEPQPEYVTMPAGAGAGYLTPDPKEEDESETEEPAELYLAGVDDEQAYLIHVYAAAANPHEGQPVVWIGGVNLADGAIAEYVADYNRDPSSTAWIKMHDYSAFDSAYYYDVYELEDAYQTLSDQISSGTGPDLVYGVNDSMLFENSRMLVDLNPYINGIHGLEKEEYFTNFFTAFETEGKLYQIPLAVSVWGCLTDEDLLESVPELSFESLLSAQLSTGTGKRVYSASETAQIDDWIYRYVMESIDRETGVLEIDRESLRTALELARSCFYPDHYSIGWSFDDYYYGFVCDPQILIDDDYSVWYGSVSSLYEYSQQNTDLLRAKWRGYPSDANSGESLLVFTNMAMGITNCSTHKDQAWDFIRYMLSRDVQEKLCEQRYSYVDTYAMIPVMDKSYLYAPPIAVNIAAERTICENEVKLMDAIESGELLQISRMFEPIAILDSDVEWASVDEYIGFLKSQGRRAYTDPKVDQLVYWAMFEYLNNGATTDQTIDFIEEKYKEYIKG